jgi:hypothetical protein
MTDPSAPATAPAGWYPVEAGSPHLRWWDGTQWTDHHHTIGASSPQAFAAQALGAQAPRAQPPSAPAGTSPYTVWIWIFAILPLVQLIELPFLIGFFTKAEAAGASDPTAMSQLEFSPGSGYLTMQAISLLVYAVCVVIAVFDYLALKSRGVVGPFPWAWAFLSAIVYAIGRGVVVQRRTGSGLAPMWVFIAATAISLAGVLFVAFSFVAAVVRDAG